MSVSLPSDKPTEIEQLVYALLQRHPVTVVRLFPLWARYPSVPVAMYNFANCAVSFIVTYWMFMTLPLIYFCFFAFLCSHCVSSRGCPDVTRVWFLCNFLFLVWLLLLMLCPIIRPSIFQVYEVPVSCCGIWSGSMHKVHIASHELQAVAFMLHEMAFQLSIMVVALYLDRSTAKAYLCNTGSTASLFSIQVSMPHFESGQQVWYYSHSGIHTYHISLEADYLSRGQLVPK